MTGNISIIPWCHGLLLEEREYLNKTTGPAEVTYNIYHIPTGVVSSNFEFRSGRFVQYYMIKFESDLRQVGGFLHQ
jgi:hypothetical protein